ncbi:hypothetical protein F5X68DRAFT_12019 [Plectosphaerella plurivora]|uniref:Uncharacterized protein n=1 Tax=Plectosphaerella plurivora TaxID=936078 RepID=A0A9P8V9H2_9PEZI|nr:hypothetical protein F5X68DRAFT_12019 [Plectosphaerella plurivora]
MSVPVRRLSTCRRHKTPFTPRSQHEVTLATRLRFCGSVFPSASCPKSSSCGRQEDGKGPVALCVDAAFAFASTGISSLPSLVFFVYQPYPASRLCAAWRASRIDRRSSCIHPSPPSTLLASRSPSPPLPSPKHAGYPPSNPPLGGFSVCKW